MALATGLACSSSSSPPSNSRTLSMSMISSALRRGSKGASPLRWPVFAMVPATMSGRFRPLLQLDLALRQLLAQFLERLPAHQRLRAFEHLLFFLVGVVLEQFLEHLGTAGEFFALDVGLEQVRQHQVAGGTVLLQRLEIHPGVILAV